MPRLHLLSVIICLSSCTLLSCKKDTWKETDGITYYIRSEGELLSGKTIRFTNNVPGGVKRFWVFTSAEDAGYRIYSTKVNPELVFDKEGTYYALLVIDDDTSNKNDKNATYGFTIKHGYNAAELAKLTKVRTWLVVHDSLLHAPNPYHADTFDIKEESFGLQLLNDSTVVFKNDTLRSQLADRVHGVEEKYIFTGSTGNLYWEYLYYYYEEDKVVYQIHPFQGGVASKVPRAYGITTTYISRR